MKNQFTQMVLQGLFHEANNIFSQITLKQQSDFLIEEVIDSKSIAVYTFTCFLILQKGESAKLHYCASEILSVGLTYLEGAYSAALFHARSAAVLDSADFTYKEHLLLFYSIPEKLIDNKEAYGIVHGILEQDPNNTTALRILAEIEESTTVENTITMQITNKKDLSINFMNYVNTGRYGEAKLLSLAILSYENFYNFIIILGFETGSIALYTFICFVLTENESSQMHQLAAVLISQALSHIEGAYSAGLFHARRAVELALDTDISYKEYLLLFYDIPEQLFSDSEAKTIAQDILRLNPDNKVAIDVLCTIEKNKNRANE